MALNCLNLTILAAVLGSAAAFGPTDSASASSFSPTSTKFTATGATVLMKAGYSISCTAKLRGDIDKLGKAKIESASFTGSTACADSTTGGLPWRFAATSTDRGTIIGVTLTPGPLGVCGPGKIPITLILSGTISFYDAPLGGGCAMSGSLKTTPPITIGP